MNIRHIIVAIVTYFALAVAYAVVVPRFFEGPPQGAGVFGDMFGAFNAFFAGLAFLGVVFTILLQTKQVKMQSEELRLQRQELEETRRELARSATAQEKSEQALTAQLRSTRISAQLAVIPLLLAEEVRHIEKYHRGELAGVDIGAAADHQLDAFIKKYEALEAAGKLASGNRCFLHNVQAMKSLRSDMKALYKELKDQSA